MFIQNRSLEVQIFGVNSQKHKQRMTSKVASHAESKFLAVMAKKTNRK